MSSVKVREATVAAKLPQNMRMAKLTDLDKIIEFASEMRKLSGMSRIREAMDDVPGDLSNFRTMCASAIRGGGVVLVTETRGEVSGFILGVFMEYVLAKGVKILEEVAFFGTDKVGVTKLLLHYVAVARWLKDAGEIRMFTLGDIPGVSPDYSKLGMTIVERKWAA